MTRGKLMTGNGAAAWAARLAEVDYIPAFPITPQTEIIETLAEWIDRGQMPSRLVTLDSEHSMMTAAGAAAATGVRTFTATSSQGLLYGMEMVYTVAGWHVPLVMVNVSRGLSAPLTLEADHNDVLAARDSGFLTLFASTCQEVLDLTLIAYRLSEDKRVRLPVMVNLDGFYLSFTREPVLLPDQDEVRAFLPDFDPSSLRFHAGEPISQAVAVLGGGTYSYFRYQTHMAALNAIEVFEESCREFSQRFGRDYSAVERYRCDDAEIVFVMLGAFATKAKHAVDRMRDAGQRIGLVRPRLFRPLPQGALRETLGGMQAAVVIDQNVSMGKGGVLHTEIGSALYGHPQAPMLLSFMGGLGGRDIAVEEFFAMAETARDALAAGQPPPPRLLYTETELKEMRKLQAIAHVQGQPEAGT